MSAFYDLIQTFNIVPDSVNGATEIMLTSIDLFFKSKPEKSQNISGLKNPGISIWICEVSNNEPIPEKVLNDSIISVEYDRVNTSGNAEASTTVSFETPVILKSGVSYGIVIKNDDPAFDLWINKQGDKLVSASGITNVNSSGSQGKFKGILYKPTTTNEHLPISDQDLKFKVKIAKFVSTDETISLVNKSYEFFTINSSSGFFRGGETVYQDEVDGPGTILVSPDSNNIRGTGTSFLSYAANQKIIISDGVETNILEILNIDDDLNLSVKSRPSITGSALTYKLAPTAEVYYTDYNQNKVYLVNSTASNSTFKFDSGNNIVGEKSKASANIESIDRYRVDSFSPKFSINSPVSSSFTTSYNIANSSNQLASSDTNLEILKNNESKRESYILSRSQEVVETNLFGAGKKSAVINVSFTVNDDSENLFAVPYINKDDLDFYVYQNDINSSTKTTLYGIDDYDTEVEKNGLGLSKYIAKKISFAENRLAEDIRVYLTAYRPAGTEIRVYAKVHNNADKETFDDKKWSPLTLIDNVDKFSGTDKGDLIEYSYGLPQHPEIRNTLSGTFTTSSGSNLIATSEDLTASISPKDEIRVYDPLVPENHEIFVVESITGTDITVNKPITNINIIGSVYVDRLKYKNTAWNNIANDNIARYVNTEGVEFDLFSSMQIKIVYLSDDSYLVPRAQQIQAIGVSA